MLFSGRVESWPRTSDHRHYVQWKVNTGADLPGSHARQTVQCQVQTDGCRILHRSHILLRHRNHRYIYAYLRVASFFIIIFTHHADSRGSKAIIHVCLYVIQTILFVSVCPSAVELCTGRKYPTARPGPARQNFGPARPGPSRCIKISARPGPVNEKPGPARPGPARQACHSAVNFGVFDYLFSLYL